MEQKYQIIQNQKQIMSQKQLQGLQLLSMTNAELDLFLRTEYLENPMLEQTDESAGAERAEILPSNEEGKWNRPMEEPVDLKAYLKQQLKIGAEDRKSVKIKEYLIECVEDTGYFTMQLSEAAQACGVSLGYIEHCMEELRLLEPVGVFSANLTECLLCQLKVLGIENQELEIMIREHLEDVAEGRISRISRALHISTAQVRKHILLISTLKPRPAMGFGGSRAEYIVPDIVLRREGEKWEIELHDSWMGGYRINDYYLKMMTETRDLTLKKYFQDKAGRARLILQNVEQRRQTLLALMQVILAWQLPFFAGRGSLRPMTMTEAAEKMGVNPSTVSRAVKGKYLQYPQGTLLLKELFSQGIAKDAGETEVNAQEIKRLLAAWVKEEDKKKPYSDQKLKEMLEEQEIYVSRRVVAKYRSDMGIKGSFDRKE